MFAVNLKSLVSTGYLKLSKDACCCIFKNKLLEKSQKIPISKRSLAFISYSNKSVNQTPLISKEVRIIPKRSSSSTSGREKNVKILITWKSVLVAFSLGSLFFLYLLYLRSLRREQREKERKRALGKAQIGGKFDLVNQFNEKVKSEDFLGNWLLIYFGFTHCPDICPDEIEKMVNVCNEIEKTEEIKNVTPIFITVDPERDSPSVVGKYVKEFSDKLIGLTGTTEQIAKVCKAYRVYFSPGPKDSDADYIVDHTIIMYLIDPEGGFMDYFGQNKSVQQIVDGIHYNQVKYEHTKRTGVLDKMSDAIFG